MRYIYSANYKTENKGYYFLPRGQFRHKARWRRPCNPMRQGERRCRGMAACAPRSTQPGQAAARGAALPQLCTAAKTKKGSIMLLAVHIFA